jgi:xanthine dehydrogenase small subunit
MYGIGKVDVFDHEEDETIALLREITSDKSPIQIASHRQVYLKPLTLEDALLFRREHPDAMVVAGSTDVALLQTKKRVHLEKILDISAVAELNFIVEDHQSIAVGATTSLEELHRYTKAQMPYLHDILKVFGSLQIRNMATLGGNVGTASPIGDTLPVLLVLNSNIRLLKAGGQRQIPIDDFIVDYRKTALQDDELIAMVSFEKPAPEEIIRSYKISKRKDLDISSVSGCFRLQLNSTNHVKEIRMAFGGVAAMPKRALAAEDFLKGKPWNEATAEAAGKILFTSFTPISDARSGAEARNIMTRNLLIKFWSETLVINENQQNN